MSYATVNGARFFYTDSGGDGAPLVLLHGWTSDSHTWDGFVARVTTPCRIIAVDLRGHGRSETTAEGYSAAGLADDVIALMSLLELKPAVVMGHSLGAVVASIVAVEEPERVRALVVVDPPYGKPPGHTEWIRETIERGREIGVSAVLQLTVGRRPESPMGREAYERVARRIAAMNLDVIWKSLAGLHLDDRAITTRPASDRYLIQRRCPVLALHADGEQAEWERTLIRHPASRCQYWPGAGHFMHLGQPDRFAAEIDAWMAPLLGQSQSQSLPASAASSRLVARVDAAATSHPHPQRRRLLDISHHVGQTTIRRPAVTHTVADALRALQAMGQASAVLSPAGGDSMGCGIRTVRERNNALVAAASQHPDAFPAVFVDADLRLGPDIAAAEAHRCLTTLAADGLCIVPTFSGYQVSDVLDPLLRVLEETSKTMLVYPTTDASRTLFDLAKRFPAATFVLAHAPLVLPGNSDALRRLQDLGNVYFDTSQNVGTLDAMNLRHLIEVLGTDRIVFGSDTPYFDAVPGAALIDLATTDRASADKIAWGNASRLLGIRYESGIDDRL